ncbi:hypothetical protein [Micromonospora sp. NPDC048898]|uniref:hypothetical protein n=1 Tax=Micromonospora sp. NPDC048898 TaxID=3364260 RepID=UPI003713987F
MGSTASGDEYRLLIFPVVLGQGKRLFAEGTTTAGVVYATYEVAGQPSYGTVLH